MRRALLWPAFLPLIIVSGILVNWVFLAQLTFAAPAAPYSTPGHNTVQQFLNEGQPSKANQAPFQRPSNLPGALKPATANAKASTSIKPLPSAEPAKMKDMAYALDDSFVLHRPAMKQSSLAPKVQGTPIPTGTTPFAIKGSDGRLEVDVPRGSLDFATAHLADGSAPIGQLILQIHQISGHSIEDASILGMYHLQIVDSQGNTVQGVVLKKPATIIYHYQTWEMQDLNLNPTEVSLVWTDLVAAARTAKQSTVGMVAPMSNNASARTLAAQTSTLAGPLTVSGPPEINAPAKPDLFEASGNSGQYSYSYPLPVAPGPGGFAPQLALSYSSQGTNERYNRRAPTGDAGEGFSLSLGSITATQYPSSSTGGAATYYSINNVDGVSDKLLPIPGQPGFYDTQHLSHLSVYFTGTFWRVFDRGSMFYEFGYTPGSVRKTASGTYEWDLDKMVAPYPSTSQFKVINISYLQDSPDGGATIRDAGIKQIQYGFSTDSTTLSLVTGTVDFHYSMPNDIPSGQGAFATAYPTNYNCASTPPFATTLRCDDPPTYNGLNAPDVMSTMSLDSVTSYMGADTANQPAYQYNFSYQDQPFVTNYWYIGGNKTAAGEHLLTQITPTVYVQGNAHVRKGVVFSYANALRVSYDDPSQNFSGQTWWSYLNHYQDLATGLGATITYELGFANPLGTPYVTNSQGQVTDDRFDPFYCANQANNSDTSKQCNGVYAVHDDYSWSMELVSQIAALGTDSSGNPTVATTTYNYALTAVPASNDPVSSCNPITGGPAQETDCVLYNWVPGYNGTQTPQHDGDWADYYHAEYRGFNVVYTTSASGNLTVDDYFSTEGWWKPQSDGLVYNGGQLYQENVYQGNVATPGALLQETDHDYTSVGNIPAGNTYGGDACNGLENPVYNPCMQVPLETKTIFYNGQGGSANAPWVDTKYTYDDLNNDGSYAYSSTAYHNLLQEVISSSNAPTITKKWTYQPNVQMGSCCGYVNVYLVDKMVHNELDDSSGHVWQCQDTAYDEGESGVAGWPTAATSYSTCGNASTALKSYTAYDQYGNVVGTVDPLAAANPSLYSGKGCSVSGVVALSAAWTTGRFTSCTSYDVGQTANLPVSSTNALGQSTSTAYDYTSGAQAGSDTDANGQKTSYGDSYDGNGNATISASAPGESGSYTTRQSENSTCTTSSTLPCYEIDSNSSLYSTAISHTFYDAQGRAVETRTPGPTPGDDTVVMTVHNDQNDSVWKSVPFQVADGSGYLDPTNAKDINGTAPAGTTTFSDALGRIIATQDPNFNSSQEPGLACSFTLSGKYTSCINYSFSDPFDATLYSYAMQVDANGHHSFSWTNALGNTIGTGTYGNLYPDDSMALKITEIQYNALNKPTSMTVVDEHPPVGGQSSVTTTMTYDDQGRLLTMNDPDQGTLTYSYDPDGHILSVVQTSGSSSRTLGYNYDLLGRQGCEQTAAPTINATGACSAGSPLVQNTYDTTKLGTQGSTDFPVGQLTQSVATTYYPDGTSATATEQFQHDQRGRVLNQYMQLGLPAGWGITNTLPTDTISMLYNDANQVTTTSTLAGSEGYTFANVYDPTNGTLQGLSNNGNSTSNLAQLAYNEYAQLSGITLLNGAISSPASIASETFNYDANLRPLSLSANWLPGSGNSGQILSQGRSYDNASNVTGVNTSFAAVPGKTGSGGTETQNFCYDEQNRLIWSGNGGTQPGAGNGTCGSGTLASGLSGASYTAPYSYTNLGQIWQGPVNGQGAAQQYLYCNSAPHQLSGIYPIGTTCANKGTATAVYSASYDPWGNETSRTYSGTTATLSYDALNRLTEWNVGSNKEWYVYDASGTRVFKRSLSSGVTRLTTYAFGLQELTYGYNGYVAGQTDYYSLAGHLIGSTNGTTATFYLTDALGSVLTSLSATAVQGEQVYGPYGNSRYQMGNINTAKGYTGQLRDAVTGLDYYNARYYDPVVGVFLSVDSVQGNMLGFDPYAYVGGNPETRADPTGQMYAPFSSGGGAQALTPDAFAADANAYSNHTSRSYSESGLPPILYLHLYHRHAYDLMSGEFSSVSGELHREAANVTQQIEGVTPKDPNYRMEYNHGPAEQWLGAQISQAQGGGGTSKAGESGAGGGGSVSEGVGDAQNNTAGDFSGGTGGDRKFAEVPDSLMLTKVGVTKQQYLGSGQKASQYNFYLDSYGTIFLVQKGVHITSEDTLSQASSKGQVMCVGDVYTSATVS